MTNAQELFDCCIRNVFPSLPVIADYFGSAFGREEDEVIVLGVYKFLVCLEKVSAKELHDAMLRDKLQELVARKYAEIGTTKYYRMFKERQIKLDRFS